MVPLASRPRAGGRGIEVGQSPPSRARATRRALHALLPPLRVEDPRQRGVRGRARRLPRRARDELRDTGSRAARADQGRPRGNRGRRHPSLRPRPAPTRAVLLRPPVHRACRGDRWADARPLGRPAAGDTGEDPDPPAHELESKPCPAGNYPLVVALGRQPVSAWSRQEPGGTLEFGEASRFAGSRSRACC